MNDIDKIMPKKSFIKGYPVGANISILNTIYLKPQKLDEGGMSDDWLYIIFKDLDTNETKLQCIKNPPFRYYIANNDVEITHNHLYIEASKVHPIICKYRDLLKSIATETNNLEWFYNNIKNGNYKENDKLLELATIFEADLNIEDFYRFEFARLYKNSSFELAKMYLDIEADIESIGGNFPLPGQCPVNAVSITDDKTKTVYSLLLEDDTNPQIAELKNNPNLTTEVKEFVKDHIGGWKKEHTLGLDEFDYKIIFFKDEIDLLTSIFNIINSSRPDMLLVFNMAFDIPYLIARLSILGVSPKNVVCDPTFPSKVCNYYIDPKAKKAEEKGDNATISTYPVYMDQLILFASRRKGQRAIGSNKLDSIGERIANIRKLDYSHITRNIALLPRLDYKTFIFYNIMDTIVQKAIEFYTGDTDFALTKALSNNTRYAKIHRQSVYLKNRFIQEATADGYVIGINPNKHTEKIDFPGAIVADPLLVSDKPKLKLNGKAINILDDLVDFDYTSLYPSIIEENNMCPTTMHGKILFHDKLDSKENRFSNDAYDRVVWFVEDMLSQNWIDFGSRYLGLPSYEEMFDLIQKYYTTIESVPTLRLHDPIKGKRIMCHSVSDKIKRNMCHLVDNTKKRDMIHIIDKMPKKQESE